MKKSLYRRNQLDAVIAQSFREDALPYLLGPAKKKTRTNFESKLQQGCVTWFRRQYPKYSILLFAIPNGGKRNVITASIMKAEGTTSGVSDLMLAIPRKGRHGFFIEMKFGDNNLSAKQSEFKQAVQTQNYHFATCWTLDQFMTEINHYLSSF